MSNVLKVPISKFKNTKIVATIGPATNSYDAIYKLIDAGANGIRLNFSHGTYEERIEQISRSVDAGTYTVSGKHVADALIRQTLTDAVL